MKLSDKSRISYKIAELVDMKQPHTIAKSHILPEYCEIPFFFCLKNGVNNITISSDFELLTAQF